MKVKNLLKISRPRFWMYTVGPFLIGYIAGNDIPFFWQNKYFALFLLFFLLPANMIIYGVNDIFDEETDKLNERKGEDGYEYKLRLQDKKLLLISISLSLILGISLSLVNIKILILMCLFIFLAIFYSAKPLRFKASPFIDACSNFMYIVPGLIGYVLTTNNIPSILWWIIGLLYVAGMQVYSAIPDIEADKAASIRTTAVYLGKDKALVFVLINWLLFSILLIFSVGPVMLLTLVYPLIPALLIGKDTKYVNKLYGYFYIVNIVMGFLGFWYIFFQNISFSEVWTALA